MKHKVGLFNYSVKSTVKIIFVVQVFLAFFYAGFGVIHCFPAIRVPREKLAQNGPPKPFAFKYGVFDEKSGSNYDHQQQQDKSGVVSGN